MGGSPWAGSEELWAEMAAEALAVGHEVGVTTFHWPEVHPKLRVLAQRGARLSGRRHDALPTPDEFVSRFTNYMLKRIIPNPPKLPRLRSLFTQSVADIFGFDPDVVCVSQGWPYDVFETGFARELAHRLSTADTPYVIVCQSNNDSWVPDARMRTEVGAFYRHAARALFVSEHNRRLTERQLALALEQSAVVQNPVNLPDTSIVPWPTGDTVRFACVGRLHAATKGQDILLAALSSATWQAREWKLDLFGTGPDQEYFAELVMHYQLGARVVFRGHVASVRDVWADHHLLVLPSRAEGTPLALVEAMLCGRPAVVTDVGGNAEWLLDGQTGYLAAATQAVSVAAALERAWLEQPRWRAMGDHAHAHASLMRDANPGRTLLDYVALRKDSHPPHAAQELSSGFAN